MLSSRRLPHPFYTTYLKQNMENETTERLPQFYQSSSKVEFKRKGNNKPENEFIDFHEKYELTTKCGEEGGGEG